MEIQNKELHRITSTAIIYREEEGKFKYLITPKGADEKGLSRQMDSAGWRVGN